MNNQLDKKNNKIKLLKTNNGKADAIIDSVIESLEEQLKHAKDKNRELEKQLKDLRDKT